MSRRSYLFTLSFLLFAFPALAEDWPGWRGPTGQGISASRGLPLKWGGKLNANVLWKAPLPGTEGKARLDQNQSSPIVSKGRVIVTHSFWPAGVKQDSYPEHHVLAYRAKDGKLLWDVKVAPGPWLLRDLRGGYTAPTPASDGERIYVAFGSAVLAALDHDGKEVWRKEIRPYSFDVALGASPVIWRGKVLLLCDQVGGKSRLLAYDGKTGDLAYTAPRPKMGFSHSTPLLLPVGSRTQLIVSGASALQGLDPDTGNPIWSCSASGDASSPAGTASVVYADSGRGSPGVAVDPTGKGEVTKSHRKWSKNRVPGGLASPLVVGEYLYRLCTPDLLRCYKLATGEEVYSQRVPGANVYVSPVVTADGRIYCASAGRSVVVKAGPTFEIVGGGDLGDGSNASPAVADGRLYLKGRRFVWCIGDSGEGG